MYYVLCIMYNVATGVWGCALMEMAVVDCVLINWRIGEDTLQVDYFII